MTDFQATQSSTVAQACRLCGEQATVFSSLRGWLCAVHRDTLVYDAALPPCVQERASGLWHVARGEGDTNFQPILCHDDEGINLPGNRQCRQPTCVQCYRLWRFGRVLGDSKRFAGSDDPANPGGAVGLVDAAGTTGQAAEGGSTAPEPVPTWNGIPKGSIWQRHKDGKHYEVVFGHEGWRNHFTGYERPPRIQLRVAGAQNLKSTHWIDPENLRKLYRRSA